MKTRRLGLAAVILFSLILIKTIFLRPKPTINLPPNFEPTIVHDTINLFGKKLPRDSVSIREDGHSDSMIVRVDSASFWPEPKGAMFKLLPGYQFYTTYLSFINNGHTFRHPIDFYCSLVDDQDSSHGPAIGASHRQPTIELSDSISPGTSRSGWLTFAIRKKNHPVYLEYEEIMNGQPVKIMLGGRNGKE